MLPKCCVSLGMERLTFKICGLATECHPPPQDFDMEGAESLGSD
jgi:hypothetical protein